MTTEEKFNAAVNVIRSLPKNGSYQPSNVMKLRFYGFYKQATEGPCKGPRPPFWDAVGRAKYDAWKALGDMPKATAMANYVDELHKIVETMSYTDKVANFLEAPTNELDNINMEALEVFAGDVLERVRSQPNSPLASREASPQRIHSSLSTTSLSTTPSPQDNSDHSDDEYIDSMDVPEPRRYIPNGGLPSESLTNGVTHKSRSKTKTNVHHNDFVDISAEITKAIQNLRVDVERMHNRVTSLEDSCRSVAVAQKQRWGITPQIVIIVLLWPFVASFITNRFLTRK